MTVEEQKRRHENRVLTANALAHVINTTKSMATGDPELSIIYDAHALLMHLVLRLNELEHAAMSLAVGVEELKDEWPTLELPSEGRHNELIGFLFATLPLTQKALR